MDFVLEPIVSLKNNREVGYEVLFRGLPVDRERLFSRLDENIDFEIFKQALKYLTNIYHERSFFKFFVNIKPITLVRYKTEIKALLEELPFVVVLELREDFLEEVHIKELSKVEGFMYSLDDFGRGSSNIDRIVHLKPQFIKLDLEVLKHLPLEALVMLSEAIKKTIPVKLIMEKVETEKQLSIARACGVELAQGWYWNIHKKTF